MVLLETKIDYYLDSELKGSFSFIGTSTVEAMGKIHGKSNVFRLTTGTDELFMHGNSAAESEEWILAIREVIRKFLEKGNDSNTKTTSISSSSAKKQLDDEIEKEKSKK